MTLGRRKLSSPAGAHCDRGKVVKARLVVKMMVMMAHTQQGVCQGAEQEEAGETEVMLGHVLGETCPTEVAELWLHFITLSASPADKEVSSQSTTGRFLLRGAIGGSAGTVAAMPPSFWSRGGSKELTCDCTSPRLARHQHLVMGKDAF